MHNQEGNMSTDVLLQMVRSGLRACPMNRLPAGNSTTHPFPLSVHSAWMLQRGIEEYTSDTLRRSGDADTCLVRIETAMAVASKLRDWCAAVDAD